MTEKKMKWMRVVDPGSPLCGWDLLVDLDLVDETDIAEVHAARRLDTLLGDRPLQFNPPGGLGLLVDVSRLDESPLQDGIVEMAADSVGLFGDHIETREYRHTDDEGNVTLLTVEVFTDAVQVALALADADKPISKTWFGPPDDALLDRLEGMSEDGDVDGLLGCIQGGDDGRAQA